MQIDLPAPDFLGSVAEQQVLELLFLDDIMDDTESQDLANNLLAAEEEENADAEDARAAHAVHAVALARQAEREKVEAQTQTQTPTSLVVTNRDPKGKFGKDNTAAILQRGTHKRKTIIKRAFKKLEQEGNLEAMQELIHANMMDFLQSNDDEIRFRASIEISKLVVPKKISARIDSVVAVNVRVVGLPMPQQPKALLND
jgi:hypothetical protein